MAYRSSTPPFIPPFNRRGEIAPSPPAIAGGDKGGVTLIFPNVYANRCILFLDTWRYKTR